MKNKNLTSPILRQLTCIILSTLLLFSCGSDGLDKAKCLDSVKKEFPDRKIFTNQSGSILDFYVLDSLNNLYLVKTGNFSNADITDVTLVKRQQ